MAAAILLPGAMLIGVLAMAVPASAEKVVLPDRVYGEGGSREIETNSLPDGTKTTTITVRDKNGTIREFHKRTEDQRLPTTSATESHEFWDDKGKRAAGGHVMYDPNGDENWWQEDHYDAAEKRDTGELYQRDSEGKWTHSRWDKRLEKWVPVKPKEGETQEPPKRPPKGPHDIEISSGAYLGLALLLEDDVKRFTTLGFDASYTCGLSNGLGVIGDIQWTHGTNEGVTYSKLEAMGGVAFRPHVLGKLSVIPHALAGLSRVTRDFHSMFVTSTPWATFAVAVGADLRARFNDRMDVQGRIDYNPTIRSGVSHNLRIGIGVWYSF